MYRFAVYPVEEILPLIGKDMPGIHLPTPKGLIKVKTNSPRLECLKRNQTCVRCGVVGNLFALEGTLQEPPKNQRRCYIENCDWCATLCWKRNSNCGIAPHLNLYAQTKNGLILMTQDHIIPRSKGGSKKAQSNLQCMCTNCNQKKGSLLPHEWIHKNSPSMDGRSLREQRLQALEQYADHLARSQKRAA
jgi:hypothetical protein